MFLSEKLENKAMTHKIISVKNTGTVTINGLPGGKSMPLAANADGEPLDQRWRRLTRRRSDKAILQVSESCPLKVAAKTKPTKTQKKGEKHDR